MSYQLHMSHELYMSHEQYVSHELLQKLTQIRTQALRLNRRQVETSA